MSDGMKSAKASPSQDKSSMASTAARKSYRDMSYREKPATPNSPSGTSVTTMYDHLLSPASPAMEEEKDDRLRNDLLDEICNDMGIDDSMDLDFDDFCCSGNQQQPHSHGPGSALHHKQHKHSHTTPYPTEGSDIRKTVTTVSSYSSSDSLCAIAKLTQSISTDVSNKSATQDATKPNMASSDHSSEDSPQSDQSKLNQLRLKAEAAKVEPESPSECQPKVPTSTWNSVTAPSWQAGMPAAPQARRSTATLDYSYSDDYVMDDMTAPDTMINFSEMPQQPNYYQLPQSGAAAHQDNISFSLNLYPNAPASCSRPAFPPQQGNNNFEYSGSERSFPPHHPQQRLYSSGAQSHPSHFSHGHPTGAPGAQNCPPVQQHAVHDSPTGSTITPKHAGPGSNAGTVSGRSSPACSTTSFQTSQQGFMQRLVTDKSSAFRSHPLFPLLRDLIIADMNFHEPSFPHQLIRDLPSDFNKLLKNYLTRNPPKGNYQSNESVESVVMDALKYAHHTLIEKIQQKKANDLHHHSHGGQTPQQTQSSRPAPCGSNPGSVSAPASSIGDYCEKFDNSVRHNVMSSQNTAAGYPGAEDMNTPPTGASYDQPLSVDTNPLANRPRPTLNHPVPPPHNAAAAAANMFNSSHYPQPNNAFVRPQVPPPSSHNHPRSMYLQQQQPGMMCPPPNYTVSPNNPPLPRCQQNLYDIGPSSASSVYNTSPYHSVDAYGLPRMGHGHDRHLMYMNNINDGHLVKAMMDGNKDMYGDMKPDACMNPYQSTMKGNTPNQSKGSEGRKHASLPKEAVNIMLNWLREHQDKPYPNDDEKGMLIKQTGLSITQINYWFTNARRRLLPKWRGEDM